MYFLNLGDAAALGGSLVVSSCNHGGQLATVHGHRLPRGPRHVQVPRAGDVAGQAPCASNVGASTVTIVGTTSRFYFVLLGHEPGSAPPQASVAWAYAPLPATATGAPSCTRKTKVLRR